MSQVHDTGRRVGRSKEQEAGENVFAFLVKGFLSLAFLGLGLDERLV